MSTNLAISAVGSDWDDGESRSNSNPIKGTLIKCVDGHWSAKDGATLPAQLLCVSTKTILQAWKGGQPIGTVTDYPLPDVDSLNAKIPQSEWDTDKFTKAKVPPWRKSWIVYLLDPATMARFTFINSTNGARQAVADLRDAVQLMREVRGDGALPLVELSSKPMRTQYGTKARPEFTIVKWVAFGGGSGSGVKQIAGPRLQEVKPPSVEETLNDEIPW
jgi:hypothetical protein